MARTLDQIIAELDPTYAPQAQSLRKRQALIPGQIKEEEKGLQAKQTQAFGDILGGARRRGLGFSGIPLGEQAKYTSTEFLPALARLRQTGREQAMSLEDAILGITERRNTLAQQLRQQEIDREEQRRQFDLQHQLAQQQAARAAAGSGFNPSGGGGGGGGGSTDPIQQAAFGEVMDRFNSQSDRDLLSDFRATKKSADYGNIKDKYKVQVYMKYRPDLFTDRNLSSLGLQVNRGGSNTRVVVR